MLAVLKRIPGAKFLLALLIVYFFINFFLLQLNYLVKPTSSISPEETKLASSVAKKLADKLASKRSSIAITIQHEELSAIAKMASHLLPKTHVVITTSNIGVLVASSTEVKFPWMRYLNVTCLVSHTSENSKLHDCKVGHLPVYGALLEWLALTGFSFVLGDDFSDTAQELLTNIEYTNATIKLHAKKSKFLKEQVNSSISKVGELASTYQQNSTVDKVVIQRYLDELDSIQSKELANYVGKLFTLAQERSSRHDPVEENTAALWALAIRFGDYHFASLMNMKAGKNQKKVPKTRGRVDLTQHFIYSAILYQLGDIDVGLALGEAKEVLDSLKGGSGFSFSDLAADKAGLQFSSFITNSKSNAIKAQKLLAGITNEDKYFPFVHDLPDGFTGEDYKKIIKSIDSKNYRYVENEVDDRISKLTLYTEKRLLINRVDNEREQWLKPNRLDKFKTWHKVDTHIHSQFSDGNHTIKEIAEKANHFGCEAITITDHGDFNLKGALTKNYFNAIEQANKRFSSMTVMPGLEWNIPPLKGREHATVILPNTSNQKENLKQFRNNFDQFKRYGENLLSPELAFRWLNQSGYDGGDVKPLVLYNHPSRKNSQKGESAHDIRYWRKFSDVMVGFSGAPGHQKKQGKNNGAYNKHITTVNGWDPVVENVGGEWDQLLQQGYKVWAARASSDFHNTTSDYWPCEFSSTHVLSQSNSQNDIIKGFQSGTFWAQHGNFVKSLSFTVTTDYEELIMGNVAKVVPEELVSIDVIVELNLFNWVSEPSSLDGLELIIITEKGSRLVPLDGIKMRGNKAVVSLPYIVDTQTAIFRIRGKSVAGSGNHLFFYSNPIKLVTL